MMQAAPRLDWDAVDLVIFDVDGTLYDQAPLRLRMATALLLDAARSRSLRKLAVLRAYRHRREELADEGGAFVDRQFDDTAARLGCAPADVRAIAGEWIERRPLPHLRACRVPGVEALFDGLRSRGKRIAILSDYPAAAKIDALGLRADLVVSAADDGVARLKPDPAGLLHILATAGVAAGRALFIGDRFERDWAAATSAKMPALIRAKRPDARCTTFRSYLDPLFAPVTGRPDSRHHASADRQDAHAPQF